MEQINEESPDHFRNTDPGSITRNRSAFLRAVPIIGRMAFPVVAAQVAIFGAYIHHEWQVADQAAAAAGALGRYSGPAAAIAEYQARAREHDEKIFSASEYSAGILALDALAVLGGAAAYARTSGRDSNE
ncbi:hypothetical protein OG738_03810 [Amycolatopsis sp. NBC_01488]|uniref:hypothetical protein n=1 Tax=Amycolatopsis sp. NBC_01488 TaxID=2903563 RepID=UPI002E2D5837|nr:hypothetical protein [Amycolatopsis sp. NBC_01488]